jgi:hypothetical protein
VSASPRAVHDMVQNLSRTPSRLYISSGGAGVSVLLPSGSITWPHVDSDCARINTLPGWRKQTRALLAAHRYRSKWPADRGVA